MTSFVFSTQPSAAIDRLYIFGDSLSDTGLVFRATGGAYPPNPIYFQGRYSNGRVWVEYLAEQLHFSANQLQNFAYGGAVTSNDPNSLVPGLVNQVQLLTQTQPKPNPNALYIVWAGANDYLQGVNNPTIPVTNVMQVVSDLVGVGARKFLVGNLPDLGHLPATRTSVSSTKLSTLTQAHNQSLRRSLKGFQQRHPDVQIVTLDANTLYREAITNPAAFGFANVTSACLSGTQTCGHSEQFLFWDGIHPTTAAHRILGKAAFAAIRDQGLVPTQTALRP